MLGRSLLCTFSKAKSKASPHVITPDSNIIVDHLAFTQTGLAARFMNMLRTSNSTSELNRNCDGKFKKAAFEEEALKKYLLTYECYQNKNYRDMFQYVGANLQAAFKAEAKQAKSKEFDLGWNLLGDATKSELMMVRIHELKLSQFRISDKWFQITMKISNDEGKYTYNVLEKHEKSDKFKFVKFDA